MRNKIFYNSAFLIFALLLSGCTGGKPTVPMVPTDEDLIRVAIKEFFSAVRYQKWNKAKSYCVYGENAHTLVENLENVVMLFDQFCNDVTLNYTPNISEVDIDGTDAHAYGYLTIVLKCDGQVVPKHSGEGDGDITLQKIGGKWKLLGMVILQ